MLKFINTYKFVPQEYSANLLVKMILPNEI